MSTRPIEATYFTGIIVGMVAAVVFMTLMIRMQTASGWCNNIARDSTEPYAVVYDRCMAEVEARRQKGIQ